MYTVVFLVLASGATVEKTFYSPYLARRFANKLKYSKKCRLISTIGFY